MLEGEPQMYPVTENGRPDGKVRGFLCARCLRDANSMRDHIKAIMGGVRVSHHAVERYGERFKGERISEERLRVSLIRLFAKAKRIYFKDHFMAERLQNNSGVPAHYWFNGGYIFVTTQTIPYTIVTVERAWGRRLGRDFWYTEPATRGRQVKRSDPGTTR
jgi:hypothetical protein